MTEAETKHLTILYADICDSVGLYERVGDTRAHQLAQESMSRMAEITRRQGGTVIRTQGDGVMTTFPSAAQACVAAREMQDAHADGMISIKVGFNSGDVIPEGGDVYGDAVNMAARVMSLARAGEILTTEDTVAELGDELCQSARPFDQTTVKGRSSPIGIYSLVFEEDEQATQLFGQMTNSLPLAGKASLILKHQDQQLELSSPAPPLHLGRSTDCQLVVNNDLASRRHCYIEPKRDHFMVIDQSTNGTYVTTAKGETLFLKRESARLVGSGVITLGYRPEEDSQNLVHYAVTKANAG